MKWKTALKTKMSNPDEDFKRSMKLIDEYFEKNKPPTLFERILEWHQTNHNVYQSDYVRVGEIVSIIENWLPKEDPSNSIATSQWNKCVRSMKSRLR